jgi:ketosteroid isomerase-like protein
VSDFVAAFGSGWGRGGEEFLEHFSALLHPDVLLIQPLTRPVRGVDGFRSLFAPLFRAMPDLRGEVLRWGETSDGVVIELRLSGTAGGRPLEWISCDRIVLEDGLIRERRAYYDPLPLLAAVLTRPRLLARILPAMLRR